MSSWSKGSIQQKKAPGTLVVNHDSGFFSCCSMRLEKIVEYYNQYVQLPNSIDSSQQFLLYRPSVCEDYFLTVPTVRINQRTAFENWYQFMNYTILQFSSLLPFVRKYFQPTPAIEAIVSTMEKKYTLDYKNLCVLFFRGNDKATETQLPSYNDYIVRGKAIQQANPKIRFIVQSDELEFVAAMKQAFGSSIVVFTDEARMISKESTSVDIVFKKENHLYSKYFLAIVLILSKCRLIVCNSGNISLWIVLYRGSVEGVQQYLKGRWL